MAPRSQGRDSASRDKAARGSLKAGPGSPVELPPLAAAVRDSFAIRVFTACFGAFLGLALLKFGSPPIMEKWITAPAQPYEFLFFTPWPVAWGHLLLGGVAVLGCVAGVWHARGTPLWILLLPLAWFGWQFLAAKQSVDPALSTPTLHHFASCAVCFYLGFFALSRALRLGWFWAGLVCGFLLMLAAGWNQHFGGLEETRKYFYLYVYPQMKEVPPEYLKKISSTRIFATLFYPNALAGALLLLMPIVLSLIWQARERFTRGARIFLVAVVTTAGLACLYWSGSKGGWLLMVMLGLFALGRAPLPRGVRFALLGVILVAGISGFFVKYSSFFQKGATSVSARFDYWEAAFRTAKANPVFGTGPGTFLIPYQKIKRPESEPSRLVHNDYLEQPSDSGIPGFLTYVAFIAATLVRGYPGGRKLDIPGLPDHSFAIWLGVLGWAIQCTLEFGLYIPALAWPSFGFLGWLLARSGFLSGGRERAVQDPLESGTEG